MHFLLSEKASMSPWYIYLLSVVPLWSLEEFLLRPTDTSYSGGNVLYLPPEGVPEGRGRKFYPSQNKINYNWNKTWV